MRKTNAWNSSSRSMMRWICYDHTIANPSDESAKNHVSQGRNSMSVSHCIGYSRYSMRHFDNILYAIHWG